MSNEQIASTTATLDRARQNLGEARSLSEAVVYQSKALAGCKALRVSLQTLERRIAEGENVDRQVEALRGLVDRLEATIAAERSSR
jgi:hypothetical protein